MKSSIIVDKKDPMYIYDSHKFLCDLSLKNNYDSIYAETIRNGAITPVAKGVNEGLLISFVD